MSDVIVVGAGLAGLVAAIRLRQGGKTVTLVSKGIGGIQLGQGTVDILGYAPEKVIHPLSRLSDFMAANPRHPYAQLGIESVRTAIEYFKGLLPQLLIGDSDYNVCLPTPVGVLRPTALVQPSMVDGVISGDKKYVFVGLRQLKDFWPELIAGNVNRAQSADGSQIVARATWLDLPARGNTPDSSALSYARQLDDPSYRHRFVAALKKIVHPDEIVGLPGILGIADRRVWANVRELLGQPIFEVSTIPPSVPGMRINDELVKIASALRVKIIKGSKVLSAQTCDDRISALVVASAGRPTEYQAEQVIFAPGGFESGAIAIDSFQRVYEPVFDLPIDVPAGELFIADHRAPQPAFSAGVRTDRSMRVVDKSGKVVYQNLYAAGGILAGAYRWSEKSGDGIALASAIRAADTILGEFND